MAARKKFEKKSSSSQCKTKIFCRFCPKGKRGWLWKEKKRKYLWPLFYFHLIWKYHHLYDSKIQWLSMIIIMCDELDWMRISKFDHHHHNLFRFFFRCMVKIEKKPKKVKRFLKKTEIFFPKKEKSNGLIHHLILSFLWRWWSDQRWKWFDNKNFICVKTLFCIFNKQIAFSIFKKKIDHH